MKMLLFDFDGVLADSLQFSVEAGNFALEKLGYSQRTTIEDIRGLKSMHFQCLADLHGLAAAHRDEFAQLAFEALRSRDDIPPFYSGIPGLLKELGASFQLGILSSNIDREILRFLDEHEIRGSFELIVGLASKRTKTEALLELKEENDIAYYIGDALSDIRAAREASIPSVAAAWGYQPSELLKEEAPDLIFERPEELLSLLR